MGQEGGAGHGVHADGGPQEHAVRVEGVGNCPHCETILPALSIMMLQLSIFNIYLNILSISLLLVSVCFECNVN